MNRASSSEMTEWEIRLAMTFESSGWTVEPDGSATVIRAWLDAYRLCALREASR